MPIASASQANSAQLDTITTTDARLIIFGTGKTFTLVDRIVAHITTRIVYPLRINLVKL